MRNKLVALFLCTAFAAAQAPGGLRVDYFRFNKANNITRFRLKLYNESSRKMDKAIVNIEFRLDGVWVRDTTMALSGAIDPKRQRTFDFSSAAPPDDWDNALIKVVSVETDGL